MFIKGNDTGVGHIVVALLSSSIVSEVYIKLAFAGKERLRRRPVTSHRYTVSFAHAGQLIVGFISALVM